MEQEERGDGRLLVEKLDEKCASCGKGPVIYIEGYVAENLWLHSTWCRNCQHIDRWETHR